MMSAFSCTKAYTFFNNVSWSVLDMLKRRRFDIDRRSGADRRRVHNLDYFLSGGIERRSWKERRSEGERRAEWMRVGEWNSVFVRESKRSAWRFKSFSLRNSVQWSIWRGGVFKGSAFFTWQPVEAWLSYFSMTFPIASKSSAGVNGLGAR